MVSTECDVMYDVCSDVFIKAYDDVMELEKSLQKLRSLLDEALSKLHQVFMKLFIKQVI